MCKNKNMNNLNIGGVSLKSHAVLAPMAGVSDRAYRELCKIRCGILRKRNGQLKGAFFQQ